MIGFLEKLDEGKKCPYTACCPVNYSHGSRRSPPTHLRTHSLNLAWLKLSYAQRVLYVYASTPCSLYNAWLDLVCEGMGAR